MVIPADETKRKPVKHILGLEAVVKQNQFQFEVVQVQVVGRLSPNFMGKLVVLLLVVLLSSRP